MGEGFQQVRNSKEPRTQKHSIKSLTMQSCTAKWSTGEVLEAALELKTLMGLWSCVPLLWTSRCKWETWALSFVSEGFRLEELTARTGAELWDPQGAQQEPKQDKSTEGAQETQGVQIPGEEQSHNPSNTDQDCRKRTLGKIWFPTQQGLGVPTSWVLSASFTDTGSESVDHCNLITHLFYRSGNESS